MAVVLQFLPTVLSRTLIVGGRQLSLGLVLHEFGLRGTVINSSLYAEASKPLEWKPL